MKSFQLDQQRANMLESLYQRSGRTCSTYTGLWEEFARDLAVNFRDTDYHELVAVVSQSIAETDSHLAEKHAKAAIAACRKHLLGEWA